MQIRDALSTAYSRLTRTRSPRLDAQVLLAHILKVERPYLVANDDRVLTAEELASFEALLQRRIAGEPIAYLTGTRAFFDLELKVSADVLVPRPETEHLVEAALKWAEQHEVRIAADIGTGSGAIAIAFAHRHPEITVHALEVSATALAIARENAARYAPQIIFHEGHLGQPLIDAGIRLDLLMANLPYINQDELSVLDVSHHEPIVALDGGHDGLVLVRELIHQIPQICQPDALILLEIGADQGAAALQYALDTLHPREGSIIKDYAGHDRLVRIEL
jgi:release factor glutamine methyltransferase